jgi:hypothetical protein
MGAWAIGGGDRELVLFGEGTATAAIWPAELEHPSESGAQSIDSHTHTSIPHLAPRPPPPAAIEVAPCPSHPGPSGGAALALDRLPNCRATRKQHNTSCPLHARPPNSTAAFSRKAQGARCKVRARHYSLHQGINTDDSWPIPHSPPPHRPGRSLLAAAELPLFRRAEAQPTTTTATIASRNMDYDALKEQWGEVEDRDGVRLSWNVFPSTRMVSLPARMHARLPACPSYPITASGILTACRKPRGSSSLSAPCTRPSRRSPTPPSSTSSPSPASSHAAPS